MAAYPLRTYFFVLVLALIPSTLSAQSGFPFTEASASIVASSQNPKPGDLVTLKVESYSLDIPTSKISWYTNGRLLAQGEGAAETQITAGALGSETRIVVTIENENENASDEILIAPVEMDLLWESTSYTPPFYKGRSFPSAGTQIKASTITRFVRTNGSVIEPKDIIYTWRLNGSVVSSVSGRGKSTATFSAAELFGNYTISVDASSADYSRRGFATRSVSSVEPSLALYQSHPLFGILFNDALRGGVQARDEEMTLVAIPYFSQASRPDEATLSYMWSVNGTRVPPDENDRNRLTINAEGSTGIANLSLEFKDTNTMFGEASGVWNLLFNAGGGLLDIFRNPFSN